MSEQLTSGVTLFCGDCLDVLWLLDENTIDSCVTDPPYHLTNNNGTRSPYPGQYTPIGKPTQPKGGFMGKQWDGGDIAFRPEVWAAVYRVLKPGAHLLAFGGTRTFHRMVCAIEDAGFEIRDTIAWLYGSGFPKSHDVSKGIDKSGGTDLSSFKADLKAAVVSSGMSRAAIDAACGFTMRFDVTADADPIGWGVSLPSPEKWKTICAVLGIKENRWAGLVNRVWRGRAGACVSDNVAMSGGNYCRTEKGDAVIDAAREWQGWGSALKPAMELIVVARKPLSEGTIAANVLRWGTGALNIDKCRVASSAADLTEMEGRSGASTRGLYEGNIGIDETWKPSASGRWPANVIHDGGEEVTQGFPESEARPGYTKFRGESRNVYGEATRTDGPSHDDDGSAARFFYCAKGDADDRLGSRHPTVKPLDLIQYLVRLVTPKGGLCLDPFAGTGTLGEACIREGMRAVLIEREEEYQGDIRRRMQLAMSGPDERSRESMKAKLNGKPVDHGPLFSSEWNEMWSRKLQDTNPEFER
jgi:DNA modification methylase